MSFSNLGSRIDEFMKEENAFESTQAQAIGEVIAWKASRAGIKGRCADEHQQDSNRSHEANS